MFQNYLVSDLKEILDRNRSELIQFQGQTVLIAGATGFIGSWLIAVFLFAKKELNLNIEIGVICRDVKRLHQKFSLQQKDISFFHEFDLNLSKWMRKELNQDYDYVFNCASSANYADHLADEKVTENLISLILSGKVKPNLINLSSGAVYGEKLSSRTLIAESTTVPNDTCHLSQYSKDKINSEKTILIETGLNHINGANARLFSFYGPHFPLDSYYAIGNFMQDAVKRSRIAVKGNPESVRSYLYPTDLVSALIKLSISPTLESIHVGSKHGISIGDLAKLIGKSFGSLNIQFLENKDNPNFYVPDTSKTEKLLGTFETVDLNEGLERWARWLF